MTRIPTNTPNLLLPLVVLATVSQAAADPASKYADEIAALEQFVTAQMAIDRIPGLSVGFIKDDFRWVKGFGFADLENEVQATGTSAYRLASNTKSMVAVAVLQLVEQGKIELDAEVQTYVPHFPRKSRPVTTRQLLGHLGGISHYRDYDAEGHIKIHRDPRDALAIFADFDLVAHPGSKFHYSSYGYNLLGAIVEGASKQPFGSYMSKHVWLPLDMRDTYMDDPDRIHAGRVKGYRLVDGELKNSEYVDISSRFAAGGTRSTVVDLLKYARGLHDDKILSPESTDLMHTSLATTDGRCTDYGMGWVVAPVNGHFVALHTGGQPETRTLLVRFPKERFALALAYNLEGGSLHSYGRRLAQLVLDEAWNVPIYTGDRVTDTLARGFCGAFNYGLAYFERYGKARTSDPTELAEAFRYLNEYMDTAALKSDFKEARKKIADGRHPAAGEAFVKVGSYVAKSLVEWNGAESKARYHKMGAIPFFHDYVAACRGRPDHPGELRLSPELEKTLLTWDRDWRRTWTADTRRLLIAPSSDLENVAAVLKERFADAAVYPDFSAGLHDVVRQLCCAGRTESAMRAAALCATLYEHSAAAHVAMGIAHVCLGQRDIALDHLQKAVELRPDDPTVKGEQVARVASTLVAYGQREHALTLLELGADVLPEKAPLYDALGEIHLRQAERLFRKALETDPNFDHAWRKLKKIE